MLKEGLSIDTTLTHTSFHQTVPLSWINVCYKVGLISRTELEQHSLDVGVE